MEVITLQLGHFSNHVGSHFWNFLDEIAALEENAPADSDDPKLDPRRLHHESDYRGTAVWNPRLVSVDLKGALGAMRASDQLDAPPALEDARDMLWDYGKVTQEEERLQQHPFQDDLLGHGDDADATGGDGGDPDERMPAAMRAAADYRFRETARSWTDFLKVPLPSSSVHELQGWHHGVDPFAMYFDGLGIQRQADEEAVIDMVRRQMELCDQLDAVHSVFDMHNGFSGVADIVLRWVHDEQPKCGKLVMAVQPELDSPGMSETGGPASDPAAEDPAPGAAAAPRDAESCAWLSSAFSLAGLLNSGVHVFAPVVVPLWTARAPPAFGDFHRGSMYESSALIAAALETASMPYRLSHGIRPSHLLSALTPSHRPTCGLLQALPMPQPPRFCPPSRGPPSSSGQALSELAPYFFDLAATPVLPRNPYSSVAVRGADARSLVGLCGELPPQARQLSFAHPMALPLPIPFPQVFGPQVSTRGAYAPQQGGEPARPAGAEVEACPTATHLHAAAAAGPCAALKQMVATTRACLHSRWAAALRANYGVEADEFREVLAVLTEHLECGAADDDDDDDDDGSDY